MAAMAGATSYATDNGQSCGSRYEGVPKLTSKSHASRNVSGIFIVAPSIVTVGESFQVGIKILTEPYSARLHCFTTHYPEVVSSTNVSPRGCTYMDNVPVDWLGTVEIESDQSYVGPKELSFKKSPGIYPHDQRPIRRVGPVSFKKQGVHYITFKDRETGLTQISNAILVTEQVSAKKLYWGDIHGHTIMTDGLRTPEEIYYFARDEAFLDICALSDHGEFYLTDYMWDYFTAVTNGFNDPSRFVTLLGFEWTSTLGHRNLYYRGNSAPIVRSTDPQWSTLSSLYKFAREQDALVVPHHSASNLMGVDWTTDHDPTVERLVEIYSIWGSSEKMADAGNTRPIHNGLGGEKRGQHVIDALSLGRKYGIIASGDFHDGRPGDTLHSYQKEPEIWHHAQRGGLVGVWADELTRESVFDALWNRHVYGTTGPRIILQFSINGSPMGSELKYTDKVSISVEAQSEVEIKRLDLVKNGVDYITKEINSIDVRWDIEDKPDKACWYYVRLIREDGEMAWSSPIWLKA